MKARSMAAASDDVAVPVDAMELEYIPRGVQPEGLLSFLMQARSDRGRCGMGHC